ncbi:glutamate receptor U1 [Callorhinchus milii]|uniref:glutamate receptor U1 n=1 Tax=Callorhinchus milii TaxID=7868 RepID=UPI001C3F79F9|nr:glutamate receptor U1 [Callorhinchus milii]
MWTLKGLGLLLLMLVIEHEAGAENHPGPLTQVQSRVKRQKKESTLSVTTILASPFISQKAGGGFEGFCVDLLNLLSEKIGFDYDFHLVRDGFYGRKLKNGSWVGMIGEITREEADLAVAPLTITAIREKDVTLTKPFMSIGLSILLRKEEVTPTSGLFRFLSPFPSETWIGLLIAYLVTCFCLFLASRLSPDEWNENEEHSNRFSLLDSFWFGVGALTLQGAGPHPKAASTRIIGAAWWLFVIVLLLVYATRLTAMLRSDTPSPAINSFQELLQQKDLDYGTIRGGSTFQFFKNSKNPTYQMIYDNMEQKGEFVLVSSMTEAIHRVQESNYAYIGETSSLEYAVAQHCDLRMATEVIALRGYGIGATSRSGLTKKLSVAILELREAGDLDNLKDKWWKRLCSPEDVAQGGPLTPNPLGGLFIFLAAGLAVAMVVACTELALKSRKAADQKKKSCCNIFSEELSFRFKGKSKDDTEKSKA